MRIAFVAPSAPARSAVGNLIAEKAAFFLDRNAEIRVFLESGDAVHPILAPHAEQCVKPPTSGSAWNFLSTSDLVFFDYSVGSDLAGLLPLLVDERPKVIVTYHGMSPSAGWPGPQRELIERGRRERGLFWCADAVVVFSRFIEQELAAIGLPDRRVHRQLMPLDISRWSSASETLPAPAKERAVLLYVGRLAPNKRVPLLIEALASLTDAEAWIVGCDGDVYAEQARLVKELAVRLGVADRVRWFGDVADEALPNLFRQADVLVLPSIHEGFGIPVIEAQAAGLPVVAARAAALPETVADAGLTFRPDDAEDLVQQVRRITVERASSLLVTAARDGDKHKSSWQAGRLPHKRIAIACFRFGGGFVGGAETSLRNLGEALVRRGDQVEVFTTCTTRESDWRNDLPAGDTNEGGFVVHRFPIDAYDKERHDRAFRTIVENNGDVGPEIEADYLANSVQSADLIGALRQRIGEFDAVIAGPYPHGLAFRVAEAFPEKTLLLPCFHDEPLARLRSWVGVYGAVGGFLYHTPEEQEFAQATLGINHPGATVVGTCLPGKGGGEGRRVASAGSRNLVYCGRYSIQKNVRQLIEFARRYNTERPNRFQWTFIGEGAVKPPAEPWCRDLGRVSDTEKHAALASADALVQLSTQESLSLVALEAWQNGTPVIVDARCPVLVGQVRRSQGGLPIDGYESFAAALDDLWGNPLSWQSRGESGRRYVEAEYLNPDAYAGRIVAAIEQMKMPLALQLRQRGFERAKRFDRPRWREEFGQFVEQILDQPPRTPRRDVTIAPVAKRVRASVRQQTLLLPCRVTNRGDLPTIATGHAASQIEVSLRAESDGGLVSPIRCVPLGELIVPGQSGVVLVPIDLPRTTGEFSLTLDLLGSTNGISVPLEIGAMSGSGEAIEGGIGPILEAAQSALAAAHERQTLPADYLDVTEGRLGRVKRWLKQKLLNNFKRAYVDVISSQQSEVNRRLVESVRQLTDCCQALDQAVRQLQERVTSMPSAPTSPSEHSSSASDSEICAENRATRSDDSGSPKENAGAFAPPVGGDSQRSPSESR